MEGIRFEEAMKIIESGEPVELTYVQYDVRRKTGGKIRKIEAQITKSDKDRTDFTPSATSKPQNHYSNFTRNFNELADGYPTSGIKTVHCLLILEVNGKKVML